MKQLIIREIGHGLQIRASIDIKQDYKEQCYSVLTMCNTVVKKVIH